MFRKPLVDDVGNDCPVSSRPPPSPSAVLAELSNIAAPPPKRVRMEASPVSDQQLPPLTVDTAQQHTEMPSSGTTAVLLSEEPVPLQCQSVPAELTTPLTTPATVATPSAPVATPSAAATTPSAPVTTPLAAVATPSAAPSTSLRAGLSGMMQSAHL